MLSSKKLNILKMTTIKIVKKIFSKTSIVFEIPCRVVTLKGLCGL